MAGGAIFNFGSLVHLLRFRAEHQPDQRAYIFLQDGQIESGYFTYAELEQKARAVAGWLQFHCSKGDRALIASSHPLEFIAAFFGCLYAGVLAVPVQPPSRSRPANRLLSISVDAEPSVILSTNNLLQALETQCSQVPHLADVPVQTTEHISLEYGSAWVDPETKPDELAFLQYTSGSTATPKGVMVSHRNLLHNLAFIESAWENTPDCINGTWLPLFHDMGLIEGLLEPLYCGYPAYIMPPIAFLQRPVRWLQMITKYKVTNSGGPNAAFDLCVRQIKAEDLQTLNLASWSFCYNGSEPVRKQTLEFFYEKFAPCGLKWNAIHPGYGLAEATLLVSAGRRSSRPVFYTVDSDALANREILQADADETRARTVVSSGPVDSKHFDVAIVDPQTGQMCEPNKVGEIWLKSESVTNGYWRRPLESCETFQAYDAATGCGPYLRTGDLGFVREGLLFITGRLKDIIIIAGRNYYPQDIEFTVDRAHPAVRLNCGAAFSIEQDAQERLVTVNEIHRQYLATDPGKIADAIREAVAQEYEIGVWIVCLLKPGGIPKTSSGKIQRQFCKQKFLAGELQLLGKMDPV